MKKIEMFFYKTDPSEKNTGLKFVLWEVTDDKGTVTHDWGFADWLGTEWDILHVPDGYAIKVVYWANTIDPYILLEEKPRIVSPHTAPVHIKTGLSGS